MAKMGRPKSENPKNKVIAFKQTEQEAARLKEYASRHNMTITEVLQRGIELQYAQDKTNL